MGKKDTVTKEYMSVPEYFADAWQKIRDVLKECIVMEDEKYSYLILGIENQSFIHYAMPVENMIYDALNYGKQASEKARDHRSDKDLYGNEFLSGFSKTDKLKPVITLVIYFGTEEWDAPRNLKEMFDEVDEEILQFVSDYKVNLLIPKEIKDFSKFVTDFGKAMKYISVSDDKEKYDRIVNEEPYNEVKMETVRLLNECVGMKIPIEEGVESVKVCKAVQGIQEDARLDLLFELVADGALKIKEEAEKAGMSIETFTDLMEKRKGIV